MGTILFKPQYLIIQEKEHVHKETALVITSYSCPLYWGKSWLCSYYISYEWLSYIIIKTCIKNICFERLKILLLPFTLKWTRLQWMQKVLGWFLQFPEKWSLLSSVLYLTIKTKCLHWSRHGRSKEEGTLWRSRCKSWSPHRVNQSNNGDCLKLFSRFLNSTGSTSGPRVCFCSPALCLGTPAGLPVTSQRTWREAVLDLLCNCGWRYFSLDSLNKGSRDTFLLEFSSRKCLVSADVYELLVVNTHKLCNSVFSSSRFSN